MSIGAVDPEVYRIADQYDGVAGPLPGNAAPAEVPAMGGGVPGGDQLAPMGSAARGGDALAEMSDETPAIEAPPAMPAMIGDPARDSLALAEHSKALSDYHAKLTQHATQVNKRTASIHAEQAQKAVDVEKAAQAERAAVRQRQEAERAVQQKQVDAAVKEIADAKGSLEGANWMDQHAGAAAVATIFGAISQGLKNAAAAQLGHVGTAENEGAKTVTRLIEQDYLRKKDRLMNADKSLLEARHGFKDVEDNQRALLNDLDADRAAKYLLAAKETESMLAQQGVDTEQIKGNTLVVDMYEKANAAQGQILNREAARREKIAHDRATESMANAHLSLSERTATATEGDRKANRYERAREFNAREADRRDAKGDKAAAAEEKKASGLDARTLRDPETGDPLGYAPTARVVDKLGDTLAKTDAYREAIEALATHIEQHGHILNPLSDEGKMRASLSANAQALGRGVKGIQASDAGQKLEHAMIGGSGVGLERTADPKVLRQLAEEAVTQTRRHLTAALTPVAGQTKAKAISRATPAHEIDDATAASLVDVRDDPKAPAARRAQAKQLLQAAGRAR